ARSTGHAPLVESQAVQERLQSYRLFAPETIRGIDPGLLVRADSLGPPGEPVRWVVAVDGSLSEVAAREAYPSTRLGYLQVASVLVDLDRLLVEETKPLVDPRVLRDAVQEAQQGFVLPGSNVCRKDMPTVKDSWRAEVFEIFRDHRVEDASLLEIFRMLVVG